MTAYSGSRTQSAGTEKWCAISGYEGYYEVSDRGRVRTLPRRGVRGRVRRPSWTEGYQHVVLFRDGKSRDFRVNRLVAAAFIRPPEGDEVCRHLNGDRADNFASNLAWGSVADNAADTIAMGRHWQTTKTHCKRGHPLEGEHVRLRGVHRICRLCKQERDRASYARRRDSSAVPEARAS